MLESSINQSISTVGWRTKKSQHTWCYGCTWTDTSPFLIAGDGNFPLKPYPDEGQVQRHGYLTTGYQGPGVPRK